MIRYRNKKENTFIQLKHLIADLILLSFGFMYLMFLVLPERFHKYITCKIKLHKFIVNKRYYDGTGDNYICERCNKEITNEQYFFHVRHRKIKKLKNKFGKSKYVY